MVMTGVGRRVARPWRQAAAITPVVAEYLGLDLCACCSRFPAPPAIW